LRHDRHARLAHDYRRRTADVFDYFFTEGLFRSGVSQPGRGDRTVLALCRHRLDLSISVALSAGTPPRARGALNMSEQIVPVRIFFAIFLALLAGTALTVVAAFYDFPWQLNTIIALTIATTKATLVVLYFMHVRYSVRLVWVILAAALFWMGIMFALT